LHNKEKAKIKLKISEVFYTF